MIDAPHENAQHGLAGPEELHLLVLHSEVLFLEDSRWSRHLRGLVEWLRLNCGRKLGTISGFVGEEAQLIRWGGMSHPAS